MEPCSFALVFIGVPATPAVLKYHLRETNFPRVRLIIDPYIKSAARCSESPLIQKEFELASRILHVISRESTWHGDCLLSLRRGDAALRFAWRKGEMGNGCTTWQKFTARIDRRRMGALAILLLESLLIWAVLPHNHARSIRTYSLDPTADFYPSVDSNLFSQHFELAKSDRLYYPYSVIPGGVQNPSELRNAVAQDPVIAEHYSDFDVAKARITRLSADRAVFVSYRVGSAVFWTKNRLYLPAGELIVTDGEHLARTRCGNRISDIPIGPTLKAEPIPAALELPAAGAPLLATIESPAALELSPTPESAISVPGAPPTGIFIPPIFPIVPMGVLSSPPGGPGGSPPAGGSPPPGGGTPPPGGPPPPPPSGPPPPISAPEPSSFLLLAASLMCVWLLKRKARA